MNTSGGQERAQRPWGSAWRRGGGAVAVTAALLLGAPALAQSSSQAAQGAREDAAPGCGSPGRRHLLGSSLFMVANLTPDSPSFYQLNYGYRITSSDVLGVEAITWTYDAPLGIPYWAPRDAPDRTYPGSVREFGVGLVYQRYLWRGLYAGAHATPFFRQYLDEGKRRIQNGFQLFLALRAGYHVGLFGDRVYVEPSVAITHWPITTHVPAAFARVDRRWPRYFLFEPGLHFGVTL